MGAGSGVGEHLTGDVFSGVGARERFERVAPALPDVTMERERAAERAHHRSRRIGVSADAATAEDDEYEAPAHTTGAVEERVNRLELDMRDGCLDRRLKVRAVEEGTEVVEQIGDRVGGRRNELRIARA